MRRSISIKASARRRRWRRAIRRDVMMRLRPCGLRRGISRKTLRRRRTYNGPMLRPGL